MHTNKEKGETSPHLKININEQPSGLLTLYFTYFHYIDVRTCMYALNYQELSRMNKKRKDERKIQKPELAGMSFCLDVGDS